ncbi:glycosyltransferase [Zobellia alginiliquefaciens]|uniref:glycosyltransferase n=1 Tax=Zobellia alginiliquefaciens TaxID=3032586 RepID=UPI0023E418EA|nr:glycosyltransferase [Zobellia alginiliquefaciens]
MKNQKHVVFLGEARFPYGLASVQRMTLMAKALLHENIKVTIICRKGSWNQGEHPDFKYEGTYEGINYIYTSKEVHKPKGFIKRNVQKIRGIYGEYQYLRNLKKNGGISMGVLSNRKLIHVFRYVFFSYLFRFPIVINLVEMASSMNHKRSLSRKINDFILDKWIVKLYDGALPISDKLKDFYHVASPLKPNLKLPIICDFDKFNISREPSEPYFLYCGSISYREVIDFILEAYKHISQEENVKLYMIVSGESKKEVARFQQEMNDMFKTEPIQLFSNIPYSQLVKLYVNASALLIPLRPTLQDSSRFPHKIGEYLASGNPVITTNIGEISVYFKDGETALVAGNYIVETFAEKMKFVVDNPEKAKKVGLVGKELGLREFDYRTHGARLKAFIENL